MNRRQRHARALRRLNCEWWVGQRPHMTFTELIWEANRGE